MLFQIIFFALNMITSIHSTCAAMPEYTRAMEGQLIDGYFYTLNYTIESEYDSCDTTITRFDESFEPTHFFIKNIHFYRDPSTEVITMIFNYNGSYLEGRWKKDAYSTQPKAHSKFKALMAELEQRDPEEKSLKEEFSYLFNEIHLLDILKAFNGTPAKYWVPKSGPISIPRPLLLPAENPQSTPIHIIPASTADTADHNAPAPRASVKCECECVLQ